MLNYDVHRRPYSVLSKFDAYGVTWITLHIIHSQQTTVRQLIMTSQCQQVRWKNGEGNENAYKVKLIELVRNNSVHVTWLTFATKHLVSFIVYTQLFKTIMNRPIIGIILDMSSVRISVTIIFTLNSFLYWWCSFESINLRPCCKEQRWAADLNNMPDRRLPVDTYCTKRCRG